MITRPSLLRPLPAGAEPANSQLDAVFFALCDPVRRAILERLADGSPRVGEIAEPFGISLQAVSRHIQVLVGAGLVTQERTGRVSRCSLEAGPMLAATVWLSRYSQYWEAQFEDLKAALQRTGASHGGKRDVRRKSSAKGVLS